MEPEEKQDRRGCPKGKGTVAVSGVSVVPGLIGNPPHEVTDEMREKVRTYAKALLPQKAIARLCGFDMSTLHRHYHDDWELGHYETLGAIASQYVTAAVKGPNAEGVKGDADRQRFILSKVLWNKQHLEISAPGGGPIRTVDLTAFLEGKSDEELANLEQTLIALGAIAAPDGADPANGAGGGRSGAGEGGAPPA